MLLTHNFSGRALEFDFVCWKTTTWVEYRSFLLIENGNFDCSANFDNNKMCSKSVMIQLALMSGIKWIHITKKSIPLRLSRLYVYYLLMAWLSFLLTNFWKLAIVLKVLFKFISLRDPINIKRFFSWFPEKSALFLVNSKSIFFKKETTRPSTRKIKPSGLSKWT